MELKDLRYFLEISRSGSVTRAAERLHIAQPALSRRMLKLEHELGATLFRRTGQGAVLTEEGHFLERRAQQLLSDADKLSRDVSGASDAISGRLRIAVPPGVGLALMPAVLRVFGPAYPNVSLQVLEGTSNLLQEWLIGGRVDIAVLHNPPTLKDLSSEPLLRETLHLILPPGPVPAFARGGTCRFRDLQDVPLIMPSLPHSNRVLLEQAAVQHGIRLQIAMEVDSFNLTWRLVDQGIAASVMTAAAASRHMTDIRGTAVAIQPPVSVVLCAATRNSVPPAPGQRQMIDLLRDIVGRAVESGDWSGETLTEAQAEPATEAGGA